MSEDPTLPRVAASDRALVLLVDDCDDTRELYAEFLADSFDIVHAVSGAEAIRKAVDLSPSLIVMDLSLPDMDGLRAIERLRADARTRSIPVIVVSGFPEPDTGKRDWDAYFVKPCLPARLSSCIDRILTSASAV